MAKEKKLEWQEFPFAKLQWIHISDDLVVIVGKSGNPLPVERIDYLMKNHLYDIASILGEDGYSQALLHGLDGTQYKILASISNEDSEKSQVSKVSNSSPLLIDVPKPELTLELLETSPFPTYITDNHTQELYYANKAALKANQQTAELFLGRFAYDTEDAPELNYRVARLFNDKEIREYEYKAHRYFFDVKSGSLKLKYMNFCSNFHLIQFCGQVCRLGQTLNAEEINQSEIIDKT